VYWLLTHRQSHEDLTVLAGDEAEFTLAKLEDTLARVEGLRTPSKARRSTTSCAPASLRR